jgi:hypothetical protein
MWGRYCEFEDNGKIRFIEIYMIEYDKNAVKRLEDIDCLEDSEIRAYLKLMDKPISLDTKYLYKLQTYYGERGDQNL